MDDFELLAARPQHPLLYSGYQYRRTGNEIKKFSKHLKDKAKTSYQPYAIAKTTTITAKLLGLLIGMIPLLSRRFGERSLERIRFQKTGIVFSLKF